MNARANRMGAREARARARSGFTRRARRRRLDGVDGVVRVRVGVEGDVRGTSSMLAPRDARELTLKTLVLYTSFGKPHLGRIHADRSEK